MPTQFVIPRRAVLAAILVIGALLVGLALYIRLPRATIVVRPATHQRSISKDIILSNTAKEPDFVRYILPAKLVEVELVEEKKFTRSGSALKDDFARGTITLFNKQNDEQNLLPKTHMRHEPTGVFFLTDAPITIPPQKEVQVGVTAKEIGKIGNVAAGKFIVDKLPASLQTQVWGESKTAFSGGVSIEEPLSEKELSAAKEEVGKNALERARAQLSPAAGGAGLRDDLVTLSVEEEHSSAEVGSKATEFTISQKIKARGFVVDENDILSLTLLALRSSPAADEEFVSFVPGSFSLEIVRADPERGEVKVKGTLSGEFASKTAPTLYSAENLVGRSESEVKEYFAQFPAVGEVQVRLSPFWVTTVPARNGAAEIVVETTNK